MPAVSKRRKPIGRPSKKTPELVNELLKLVATGAPYSICAASVGLHPDTLMDWKREDSEFAAQVEKAAAKSALRLLGKIEKHGEDNFQSLAWILERRFPSDFSRPEIQFQINNNTLNQTVNNTLVVTAEVADVISSRVRDVDAKIEKLLKDKRSGNGNGAAVLEPSAGTSGAMVSTVIVMPESPGSSWWRSLATGSGERQIERATAEKVCRLIVQDVLGRQRAQQTPVGFDAIAPILLRDVQQALDDICGSEGWKALVKRGEI
jgi:hypothetical protein